MTKPIKKPTIAAIAKKHGTSRESIRKIRDVESIDIYDDQAVAGRVAMMRTHEHHLTLTEERQRKLKAEADLAEMKVAQMQGKLVSREEVEAEMRRIGFVFGAALERLQADLPPLLDGMSAESMRTAIRDCTDQIRRAMVEEYEQLEKVGRDPS